MHTTGTVIGSALVAAFLWAVAPQTLRAVWPPEPWVKFVAVDVLKEGENYRVIYTAEKRRHCLATVDWLFVTNTGDELKENRGGPVSASLNHKAAQEDPHIFTVPVKRPNYPGILGYRATVAPTDPNCGKPVTALIAWLPEN